MGNHVDDHFNSEFAEKYEAGIRITLPTYDQIFPLASSFLRTRVADNANLLIVGAGGGAELLSLSQANPNWQFTGVDPSDPMINLAKYKVDQAGIAEKVHLFHGFTNQLPAEPVYDGATCILVLHHVQDDGSKLELLTSIADRLKPGSPLVLVTRYGDREAPEFQLITEAMIQRLLSQGGNIEEINQALEVYLNMPFVSEERTKQLLIEAGFHQITHFFKTYHFGGWFATLK
ncbi:class I SAM-dependent methyltransferase [Paenibacillus montanisoli]|uniref:Class I SAM-dependent methyltransferase n=1 Tax=Paenibacillus montanisoli TaxID=2081970 RepID=A0A328U2L3_9BACL|nr:class I SAM-dependent methyltransferase [Paenibacillus montanisoli]RAP77037.1 class I SAM-dependent methyltransferase [Paenibacillus montanisoli]